VNWTRAEFEQDKDRYQRELDDLLAQGVADGHPLVERQRRRIETVERVLTDPAYGLFSDRDGAKP
jgi:hypothetical protein